MIFPDPSSGQIPTLLEAVRQASRQVGLLRATGRREEAETCERASLQPAIAACAAAAVPDPLVHGALQAESERVADALVLAQLLAPLLQLPAAGSPAAGPPMPSARRGPPSPRSAAAAPPSIADFLDEMISSQAGRPA